MEAGDSNGFVPVFLLIGNGESNGFLPVATFLTPTGESNALLVVVLYIEYAGFVDVVRWDGLGPNRFTRSGCGDAEYNIRLSLLGLGLRLTGVAVEALPEEDGRGDSKGFVCFFLGNDRCRLFRLLLLRLTSFIFVLYGGGVRTDRGARR